MQQHLFYHPQDRFAKDFLLVHLNHCAADTDFTHNDYRTQHRLTDINIKVERAELSTMPIPSTKIVIFIYHSACVIIHYTSQNTFLKSSLVKTSSICVAIFFDSTNVPSSMFPCCPWNDRFADVISDFC